MRAGAGRCGPMRAGAVIYFLLDRYWLMIFLTEADLNGPVRAGAGRCGPVRAGVGRCGPVWAGAGRCGPARAGAGIDFQF